MTVAEYMRLVLTHNKHVSERRIFSLQFALLNSFFKFHMLSYTIFYYIFFILLLLLLLFEDALQKVWFNLFKIMHNLFTEI